MNARTTWRCLLPALLSCALLLPSCAWDGHLNVLGYSTRPNYDTSIRTVRVPIFKNKAPVKVTAPVPEHMHERLTKCGWTGD